MIKPKDRSQRRASAVEACIGRFADKPYAPGKRDCTMMARHLLHKLGIKVPFAKGVRYTTELAGVRALKAAGFKTLIEAVDSLDLPRIAPAAALAGDLVALQSEHELGSLAVALGGGGLLAYGEDFEGATRIENVTAFARDDDGPIAWRTLPGEIDRG